MALTEEQRERIRKNRERALQLQKQRRENQQAEQQQQRQNINNEDSSNNKRKLTSNCLEGEEKNPKRQNNLQKQRQQQQKKQKTIDNLADDDSPIEAFEEGASEWVTKKEAMSAYCLPEGTLAVCECKEQENPHHKSWAPMKLYRRSELRRRAHARFGGLEGLAAERNLRSERKFMKDFGGAKNVFK